MVVQPPFGTETTGTTRMERRTKHWRGSVRTLVMTLGANGGLIQLRENPVLAECVHGFRSEAVVTEVELEKLRVQVGFAKRSTSG